MSANKAHDEWVDKLAERIRAARDEANVGNILAECARIVDLYQDKKERLHQLFKRNEKLEKENAALRSALVSLHGVAALKEINTQSGS